MAPLLLLTITYHYSSPFLTLQVSYHLHICRSISSSTMVYSLSSSSSNPYSSSSTMVYSLFSSFSSPYSSSSTMVYSLSSSFSSPYSILISIHVRSSFPKLSIILYEYVVQHILYTHKHKVLYGPIPSLSPRLSF